ncbi:hypothetical protein [Pedobacter nyackensis]|uniref:Uncharacterized protein n=1 Tax=Pedobacter nyackensis TaxID=475255 RepID=A0A1W2EG66_9SPHI|nr:hypothetical protein [Pedobacter nyackensis]SMD08326.1 hypothetical protein SAMN04488101_1129 [Pedobacter nyackensis]
MPTLRPTINDNDSYLAKLIKYIPGEIIAVYTAIIGILNPGNGTQLPDEKNIYAYIIILIVIVLITPIWTYLAVIDNPNVVQPPSGKKRAAFHASIATISFLVWLYAIGDVLFRSLLCGCLKPQLDCLKQCAYNSAVASIILILFTALVVPLLERLILGKPIPPLPKPFFLNAKAQQIIDECDLNFETFKSDCSGFVKAVTKTFNVTLTGKADDIVDQIQTDGWTILKDGVDAKNKADKGWLVVAGLKSANHTPPRNNGHVVVVVSGGLAHNKYPTAYWGTLGGVGRKNTTLNYAWDKDDRDNVVYSARIV